MSTLFGTGEVTAQEVNRTETTEATITSTKKPTKKLSQPEVKYGALTISNEVFYALHIKAVVSNGSGLFGGFGSALLAGGSSETDTTAPETINTVFVAKTNLKNNDIDLLEITEKSALFGWLTGDKAAKFELPTYLNDQLRSIVGSSMTQFKGILAGYQPLSDEHIELLQADPVVKSALDDFKEAAIQLRDTLVEAKKNGGNVGLDAFIDRYAFMNHVLLAGPRGVGKSYKVTKYADDHHAKVVQLNGHSGIEAIDILGYNIRASDGSFVWLDGPLTEAFRIAQTEPVILIIDEFLRIKGKELNIFISSLTPNASNQFVLNTSRVIDIKDGIGRTEVLKVPAENLWVVATTNVGSDYDTDDIDLALADRFVTFDLHMQEDVVHSILASVNADNHNYDESHITKLVNFFKSIEALVKAQELPHGINTRHLTKVLKLAKDPKEFKSYLLDFVANVVSRQTDGNLNEAEVKIYKDALIATFGK